jgi:hypothetical protein
MIWIGIDPGTNTGLALWDAEEKRFREIQSCGIIEAMELVLHYGSVCCMGFMIRVEDARKRKKFDAKDWNPKKYQGVGSVKRDCAVWEEFLRRHELPYEMRHPWATKIDAATFKKLTKWPHRTNEHMRDAAMSVFGLKTNHKILINGN